VSLVSRLVALERTINQVAPAQPREQICYVLHVLPNLAEKQGKLPGGEFRSCRLHLDYGEFCFTHVQSGVHYQTPETKQWWLDYVERELYRLAEEDPQRLYELYCDMRERFPDEMEEVKA